MQHRPLQPESQSAFKIPYLDLELSQLQYKRPMGAYKPHFTGLPDDYYPSSWGQVALCTLMVAGVILLMLVFLVLFLLWDEKWGTSPFVLLWSIVLVIFSVTLMIGIYFGGRIKILNEREIVQEKLSKIKHANAQ